MLFPARPASALSARHSAPLGQLAALGAPQAPPEVNPSEVTSPPETSLEPAAGAAGGQPAAGAGVSPFFPTKGVTRLVGKYPRGKNILYPRSTILLACIHRLTLVQMTHGTRVDTV